MSKKPMIIVGLIFGLIIIALTVYLVLTLTTDIFKPTSEIFQRYFTKGIDSIDKILDFSKEQEYINGLQQSNYRDNTKIALKYINSRDENELFNISLNGITNNSEKKLFKNISINYGENEVMNLEYLKENQTYGLLFKDIVKQFVSVDAEKYEDILKYIRVNINDSISSDNVKEFGNIISQNRNDIKSIILKKVKEINENKYSKQKSANVTLNNGEEKSANVYSVKITEEEVKEIYLEILNKLEFQGEINRTNNELINFPEIKIDIYTQEGKLLRAETRIEKNQLDLDFYENEINAKFKNISEESIYVIKIDIKREEQNTKIDFEDSNRNIVNLKYNLNKDSNNQSSNIEVSVKNDYVKGIELKAEQKLEIIEGTIEGIDKRFENVPNFNLSKLKENERDKALNELLKKLETLISNKNIQFRSEILEMVMQVDKGIQKQFQEIKEKQKRDFNNQFLPYEGQNVQKEVIYNLLDLAGRNMEKIRCYRRGKV